jgi:single-strand DNA-binding protein
MPAAPLEAVVLMERQARKDYALKGGNKMNNITLSGHVGQTPTIKDFQSGSKVSRFTLAVKNPYKPTDEPMWVTVEAWGNTAERVAAIITAGREVIVQGYLAIEEYESKKDGKVYSKPLVKLVQFTVCGAKPKAEAIDDEGKTKKSAKKAA